MEEYRLNKDYFNKLIDVFGRQLTGKLMKKFEIIPDKDSLKAAVKEAVYEEARALKQLFDAHAAGYEQVKWEFNNKKGMENT